MTHPAQGRENSQSAMASQGDSPQNPQAFRTSQTHQAGLSQNHGQNTQGILNQDNVIGVSSHNAPALSVGLVGQGKQAQQTKQEASENQQQQPSMGNPVQVTGSSQFEMASQGGASQISQNLQSFQTHQANSSPNHDQKMQEVSRQGNGMGVSSHNASISSTEWVEQGRHIQQKNQGVSEVQDQQVSMGNSARVVGNSHPSMASQQAESSQTLQAAFSQNYDQNTQEILNQSNDMGVSSHNASASSVERAGQGRHIQQTKQQTPGNQQQQPSMGNPTQITESSQFAMASQTESPQTSQTFQTHHAIPSQHQGRKLPKRLPIKAIA